MVELAQGSRDPSKRETQQGRHVAINFLLETQTWNLYHHCETLYIYLRKTIE